ncbi:Dbl homology domain-containing protein [Dichotomocladium elegans]|nr:Dbl homology domain-containing protein [Dichotomocladium elegans]
MQNSLGDNAAMLSHVARKLYSRILPEDVSRDGVEYHYLFTGKEAVDHLVDIIHLDDSAKHNRDQALMIGRSLESLGLFRAVDGSGRLQDGTRELYRFEAEAVENVKQQEGIFTPLTACYSPTCNGDSPCYSYSCPGFWRKVNFSHLQSARQSILPDKRALWIHSVPKDLIAATPPEERKRQECIYELIFTEEDFAKDLDYVHNHWVIPLMTTDVLSSHTEKRELIVKEIFWNMADIRRVSTGFSYALSKRRKEQDLVDTIGDIMISFVRQFEPYISYGAHQVIGKHRFELEKRKNPKFAQFVRDTERKPESKRLELNGYLTKPTTRLGRYNLLLREILKRTPPGNSDLELIPQIMEAIAGLLEQVNSQTGKVSQCFTLKLIEERLISKPMSIDLKLQDPGRELLMQGRLSRKENGSSDSSDLHVFLFDHFLLMTKPKLHNRVEHYKVFRKVPRIEIGSDYGFSQLECSLFPSATCRFLSSILLCRSAGVGRSLLPPHPPRPRLPLLPHLLHIPHILRHRSVHSSYHTPPTRAGYLQVQIHS